MTGVQTCALPIFGTNRLFNIEETKKMGTFNQLLEECGLEEIHDDIFSVRKELVGFTPIEIAV